MNTGPRYVRKKSSDISATSNEDNEYPKYPEPKYLARKEKDLNVTGLREKKLLTLIIWLIVLSILALIILIVLSSVNGKTLFSAQHPLVSIDHKIKQLSSSLIITNKVRSAVTEDLDISAKNLVIRGNEGIQVETRSLSISAQTILALNTSSDGSLYFSGRHIYLGNQRKMLSMSSSPALSASVEAYRLCICKSSPTRARLFLVNGNRPCIAPISICQ